MQTVTLTKWLVYLWLNQTQWEITILLAPVSDTWWFREVCTFYVPIWSNFRARVVIDIVRLSFVVSVNLSDGPNRDNRSIRYNLTITGCRSQQNVYTQSHSRCHHSMCYLFTTKCIETSLNAKIVKTRTFVYTWNAIFNAPFVLHSTRNRIVITFICSMEAKWRERASSHMQPYKSFAQTPVPGFIKLINWTHVHVTAHNNWICAFIIDACAFSCG